MSVDRPEHIDPRRDLVALYTWGTLGWFVLLFIGATMLLAVGKLVVAW